MIHIKLFNETGEVISAERLNTPVYVYVQRKNRKLLRCIEPLAQGVLDKTGSKIYQLYGKEPIEQAVATASIITTAEYEQLLSELGGSDSEDVIPEVPEDTEKEEIMTRAELTATVKELTERNQMLEECLLEMSAIVYA